MLVTIRRSFRNWSSLRDGENFLKSEESYAEDWLVDRSTWGTKKNHDKTEGRRSRTRREEDCMNFVTLRTAYKWGIKKERNLCGKLIMVEGNDPWGKCTRYWQKGWRRGLHWWACRRWTGTKPKKQRKRMRTRKMLRLSRKIWGIRCS